jgi:hypothetical protein
MSIWNAPVNLNIMDEALSIITNVVAKKRVLVALTQMGCTYE